MTENGFRDKDGGEASKTTVVTVAAGSLAIGGTGTAREVTTLDRIAEFLTVTEKTAKRVCSTPYTDYRHTHTRSKVHIGRIHTHHHIQRGNPLQFLFKAKPSGKRFNPCILPSPRLQHLCLVSAAKQQHLIPPFRKH